MPEESSQVCTKVLLIVRKTVAPFAKNHMGIAHSARVQCLRRTSPTDDKIVSVPPRGFLKHLLHTPLQLIQEILLLLVDLTEQSVARLQTDSGTQLVHNRNLILCNIRNVSHDQALGTHPVTQPDCMLERRFGVVGPVNTNQDVRGIGSR